MSILSQASIFNLCHPLAYEVADPLPRLKHPETGETLPMIAPFVHEKTVVNGKSYGLSIASYDLRIAHDLTLEPSPGHLLLKALESASAAHPEVALALLKRHHEAAQNKPSFSLAHTIENVAIPLNVMGQVCDKSTYARMGVSCFNTVFDPGFIGNCTLELVNLSSKVIIIRAGDPICQMIFTWLDRPVEQGYDGKYQYQPPKVVPAILEGTGPDRT